MRRPLLLPAMLMAAPTGKAADLIVASVPMADQKAVLATVESLNIVPARARSGGTVGQVIAVVADAKLLLQIAAIDARADQGGTEILYAATGFEKI